MPECNWCSDLATHEVLTSNGWTPACKEHAIDQHHRGEKIRQR